MIGGIEGSNFNLDPGKQIHLNQLQKFLSTCSSQSLIKNYKQIVKYYIRLLQSSCSRKIIAQIKNQMRLIQQFYQIFNCSLSGMHQYLRQMVRIRQEAINSLSKYKKQHKKQIKQQEEQQEVKQKNDLQNASNLKYKSKPYLLIRENQNIFHKSYIKWINEKIPDRKFKSDSEEQINQAIQDLLIEKQRPTFAPESKKCLGCIEFLQIGEPIPETKQPSFIKQYNTNTFQAIFRDCACAILNLGGGFLFLNGKKGKIATPIKQDHYKIKARCLELFEKYFGHNFKSEQIESADCHKIQPIKIRNKSLIGCIVRISIRAPLMNHIYSYPILKPSCQTKFFYSVKNGNTTRFADGESLYQLSNQIGRISHHYVYFCRNESCQFIEIDQRRIKIVENIFPMDKAGIMEEYQDSSDDSEDSQDSQGEEKFKNYEFVIIKNLKKEENLINFFKDLIKKKGFIDYKLHKPHPEYNTQSTRIFWILQTSHSCDSLKLEAKGEQISVFTIELYLGIKCQDENHEDILGMQKQFRNATKRKLRRKVVGENDDAKQVLYQFKRKQYSAFLFILLSSKGYRPTFYNKSKYEFQCKLNKKTNKWVQL